MNPRRLALALVLATSALVAAPAAASGAAAPARDIPFELVGLVAQPAPINLQPGHPVRVAGESDRSGLGELLALGTDGSFADDVVALVDQRFPGPLPAGTTLLVGVVHSGCFPAASVLLRGDPAGTVTMTGEPDEEEGTVLCVVALRSVAVVAVAAAAVPPGSADGAELAGFGEAAALELPAPRPGQRRFVFALDGCGATTAELVVTPALIDATPEAAPGEPEHDCEIAEHYLAAFDVPADAVGPTAVVAGR